MCLAQGYNAVSSQENSTTKPMRSLIIVWLLVKFVSTLWLCFVWFDSLRPSQQLFSYVGTGLSELNQYKAKINVSCPSTQRSDAGDQHCDQCPFRELGVNGYM